MYRPEKERSDGVATDFEQQGRVASFVTPTLQQGSCPSALEDTDSGKDQIFRSL